MTREEFLKNYPLPKEQQNLVAKEAEKLIECVRVKSIYNQLLNASRPSLQQNPSYLAKATSVWSNSVNNNLSDAQSEKTIEEALAKSKLARELVKRGYEVRAELQIVPVCLQNGDIHHYDVYVNFYADIQSLYLFWKNENVKRKVFIFVEDGVFQLKYPPNNLLSEKSPHGFIGVDVHGDSLIICE